VTRARLDLTRPQILAFRRHAGELEAPHAGLDAGDGPRTGKPLCEEGKGVRGRVPVTQAAVPVSEQRELADHQVHHLEVVDGSWVFGGQVPVRGPVYAAGQSRRHGLDDAASLAAGLTAIHDLAAASGRYPLLTGWLAHPAGPRPTSNSTPGFASSSTASPPSCPPAERTPSPAQPGLGEGLISGRSQPGARS
jgi:hypothetical protein